MPSRVIEISSFSVSSERVLMPLTLFFRDRHHKRIKRVHVRTFSQRINKGWIECHPTTTPEHNWWGRQIRLTHAILVQFCTHESWRWWEGRIRNAFSDAWHPYAVTAVYAWHAAIIVTVTLWKRTEKLHYQTFLWSRCKICSRKITRRKVLNLVLIKLFHTFLSRSQRTQKRECVLMLTSANEIQICYY